MIRKPKYTYCRRGSLWVVLQWTYTGNSGSGAKIREYSAAAEARDETYRLNGWKKKPELAN